LKIQGILPAQVFERISKIDDFKLRLTSSPKGLRRGNSSTITYLLG